MEFHYFLLLPVTMIIGWLIAFIISGHFHQLHDRILLALLVCGCPPTYITARELVVGKIDYAFILLDNIETVFALVICPLTFLYIRTVAHEARWHRCYYWLFTPGVIICVVGNILSIIVGWDKILKIRQTHHVLFVPESNNIAENLYKWINIDIFDLTLEVMSVVLIIWSAYYLIFYHKHACNYYANINDSDVGRMHYFLLFSILIFATIFFATFFIRDLIGISHIILLSISLWLSALLCGLAYNAYKIRLTDKHLKSLELAKELVDIDFSSQNEVPLKNTPIHKAENDKLIESRGHESVSDNTLDLQISAWEKGQNKPFLKEGLTLADVAEELKISPRLLSRYINTNRSMNFSHWINSLRIEEAKRILETSPNTKIGYVSVTCGFSDQYVFSKTFHKIVGCSPQTFRDSKQNTINDSASY